MHGVKYSPVAESDDKESLTSDQELLNEFQQSSTGNRSPLLRLRSYAPYVCFCLSSCFLLAAIILFSITAISVRSPDPRNPEDYFPKFPTTTIAYKDDTSFIDTDYKGQQAWTEMFPIGGGYFNITNPEKWGLPPSFPGTMPDTYTYAASVTHQLHCLAILREIIISYQNGTTFKDTRWSGEPDGPHAFHCIEYIRQGILCASDTTIEWGLPNLDQHGKQHGPFVVSGEGSVHQCRDWNSVKGFLEAHRGLDNKHDILPA